MHLLFNTPTKRWLWVLFIGALLAIVTRSGSDLHAIGLLFFIGALCVLVIDALKKRQASKKPEQAPVVYQRIDVPLTPLARKSPILNTVDWKNRS